MLNKVILMGRLTRDPELRHTAKDIPVVSFTLAVDRPRSKDSEHVTDLTASHRTSVMTTANCRSKHNGKRGGGEPPPLSSEQKTERRRNHVCKPKSRVAV